MNTTARIENTGATGRIHVSKDTAELLRVAGKGHWLVERNEPVIAKGKGQMQTYWVKIGTNRRPSIGDSSRGQSSHSSSDMLDDGYDTEYQRLIDWNVEMLSQFLKQIVAQQKASGTTSDKPNTLGKNLNSSDIGGNSLPLSEVAEIITLPEFDQKAAGKEHLHYEIELDAKVVDQLKDYVTAISQLYHKNAFHSFAHASHVVMSVTKLMSRIVAPEAFHDEIETRPQDNVAESMHDHTYGITSDPLTQFACAFSALIHDVDHRGVPNPQLMKENEKLGEYYGGRSVAEQNSLDLSWGMLMDPKYSDLLATLCQNDAQLSRLRGLVVNSVMATDIADKDLKALRNGRWKTAFSEDAEADKNPRDAVNRKATIVIEHLIQASDVSHTMQHWHIYRKWNAKLFEEMYLAYKAGRAEKDPSEFWYAGEIGFFEFYILPLAKKLKECGVFGVSSGEYLSYALNNLEEWKAKGEEVVAEMIAELEAREKHDAMVQEASAFEKEMDV